MEEKQFIDRKDELKQLKKALNRAGPELIIVYGRRRIGKSRLLIELSKSEKIDISVMMEDADYNTNLSKISKIISEKFNFPSFKPSNFKELFEKIPNKSLIVIDEYSYISEATGEFQAIWEEIAKKNNLKIILCGSLIRIMEDINYSLKSPLYGRATEVIKLGPLKLKDVSKWYKKGSNIENILKTYFSVGGIPRYLEIINEASNKNIEDSFFSKNGLLLREGKLLIKESFPNSQLFPKIMFEIASGNTEASKIANNVGIKANEISKYLSLLIDYGFVEKRFPVLGGSKKDVKFYMADSFFSFWTKFVWPNYSSLESGINNYDLNSEEFARYFGERFEIAVMEIINNLNLKLEQFGKQWGRINKKSYEIDVLGFNNKTKDILFVEAKWKDNVDANKVFSELKEKSKHVLWNRENRKETYMIFAKSFKFKEKNCYDLKDIERILT